MNKVKTMYACRSCGYQSPKWLGRCPDCLSWNSLIEERLFDKKLKDSAHAETSYHFPQPIGEITGVESERLITGIGELDRVLGGGVVPGSVVLVGGDPGVGKSTLLLQALDKVACKGRVVLYVSGEESPGQVKLRAQRLGVSSASLYIHAENSLEKIVEGIEKLNPHILVIDSIQTVYTQQITSTPGSIAQLREVSAQLIPLAKRKAMPVLLVGHITKDGSIAGPKVLEHMVDTVLYFEGDRGYPYRILRATKNRYGSVNEIGVFEMRDRGLEEVSNPSSFFLSERLKTTSGSVVVANIEGSRPILIEVQSLVTPTLFGMPTRTAVGIDHKKVSLLVAVLEKKAGLKVTNNDIFLKIGGGIKVNEPACDLGIIASISSNFLDKPIDPDTVVFGEVGLSGEIRGVHQAEGRVKEAERLGFKRCILPAANVRGKGEDGLNSLSTSIELNGVKDIRGFMDVLF